MQNIFNNKILPAFIFVLVLHALVLITVCTFFTGSIADNMPKNNLDITVEFAVVPEVDQPSDAVEPSVAQAPEPEPEPEVDSEPQPVLEAPKPEPKPKPKIKPVVDSKPRSTLPATDNASRLPASANAAPAAPVQRGAGGDTAEVLRRVKPSYPALSLRRGEEGRVVLSVLVKADGTAGDVNVKKSSGFPRLDTAAVNAVRRWKFEPYRIGGLAADHEYSVVVDFSLLDS